MRNNTDVTSAVLENLMDKWNEFWYHLGENIYNPVNK